MLIEVLLGLAAIVGALYFYVTQNYNYWKKKGVAFVEPTFPLGTVQNEFLGRLDTGRSSQLVYTEYKKKGLKYVGLFMIRQPNLLLLDLELCKHVLTKDFHNFVTRGFVPTTHEYITKHLFSLEGQEWKDMRNKLSPTFTSGKMKGMFPLMEKCAGQLQQHIDNVVLKEGQFEVKELIARFTTDIIATCAFGLDVNSIEDKNNEFYKTGKLIFLPKRTNAMKVLMYQNFPTFSHAVKFTLFEPGVQTLLTKLIKDTTEYRKQNNVTRNDFVDLLLKVKENKSLEDDTDKQSNGTNGCFTNIIKNGKQSPHQHEKDHLTLEQMTAQAFVFFAAGFETAASTTTYCLYELSKNPEIQETLRREIDEVLSNHGGHISYQALQEMTYMDQVMNETLRLYASLSLLTRVCTETYRFPGTDLVIDKGVKVTIPIYAIHHDPDIYPDPYKFDPERFTDENMKSRHSYSFLPFGEGPRNCIGMRFGKLEVKLGLAAILSRYQLTPTPDTPSQLEINPLVLVTTPKHPLSLRITKRTDV